MVVNYGQASKYKLHKCYNYREAVEKSRNVLYNKKRWRNPVAKRVRLKTMIIGRLAASQQQKQW